MPNKPSVGQQNENYILNEFLEWFDDEGEDYQPVGEPPEPPDAIICDQNSGEQTWVEITTCLYSEELARDLFSYADAHREHVPMAQQLHIGMDANFASRFAKLVDKKFNNANYEWCTEKYGEGILVIRLEHPWLSDETFDLMRQEYEELEKSDYFDYIVICYRGDGGLIFEEWDNQAE